ncbi:MULTISPECIES: glycosyltransferase [unclassified Lentimicrobium]|uniref:glycosyltransferase n=1 Tax=unclassified Lentimicrobium TaxID=2677434 RepID=UPI0015546349|nr:MULTISPECIES: glycosyltransferase [unclassified Lentimicrobium]NPD44232.1 glycosyltransferase [Lentimicrobium sp. S6]NPD85770.1 glycosyltransferase [Lentimicrobium sp. L6]
MMMILQILFWLSVLMIFHSYVFFPLLIKFLAKGKTFNYPELSDDELPKMSILVSAFNEEAVIAEKIESVFKSNYPIAKFELLIGSDNSDDDTNVIIQSYADKHPNLIFNAYSKRRGKQNVVNDLFHLSKGSILILTDANVIFDENTLLEIARPFTDENIGLVDTNMINRGLKKEGISHQEKAYISREVYIKQYESLVWGSMMGPFGGCYAIRREDYSQVPSNALVDDFYINMKIFEKGKLSVNNLEAKVFEDVSNDLKIELIRKIRIATGNFQNLKWFGHLLWPMNNGVAFTFLSHKVLRWLGPFFLLISLLSSALLWNTPFYQLAFSIQIAGFFIPLLDSLLKKLSFNSRFLRFITHFYSMNLALFIGFFRFSKGVKSGIWKVTKRNQ